jgi:hypothetical protein
MSKNTQISELINYISYDGSGNVVFTTVSAAASNTDKFLVSDAGTLKYRTAAQLLSDIGSQPALSGTGFVKISGTTISYDNSTYATQTYVGTAISNLVDSSPATLDTLNELAAALGDDPNFATTVATSIGTKQPQLNGTGFVKVTGTTVSYDNSTYALDSAVVHLAGNESITGVKTFTGAGNTFTQNTNFLDRIYLRSASTADYTNLSGHTNQLLVGVIGATHILSFPQNTNYTYTFQATSGTLALTSNLSSYLPLAGGTLTGPLAGTTSAFTGFAINATPTSAGTGATFVRYINTGSDWYIGSESSVAGSFFGGASAYASVFFGTNPFQFITSGVKRFEIATGGITSTVGITGTSATFSSTVQMASGSQVMGGGIFKCGIASGNAGAALQLLGWTSGAAYSNWQIDTAHINAGFNITPSSAGGGSTFTTPALTILTSGAATFSSTLTSTDHSIKNSANAETLDLFLSPSVLNAFIDYPSARSLMFRNKGSGFGLTLASTGSVTFSSSVALSAIFNSTSNTPYIRLDESSNAKFFIGQRGAVSGSGGTGYDFYSVAGNDIRFFTGGSSTTALCIDTSRNLGVGTVGPNAKLTVWTPSTTGLQTALRLNNPFGFTGLDTGSKIVFSQDRSTSENLPMGEMGVGQEAAGTSDYGYMFFSTLNGTMGEKVRITSNGNVGIGFNTVTNKLQVAGAISTHASANTSYYAYMNYLGTTYNFGSSENTDNVDFKVAGGTTWTTGGNIRFWTQAGASTPLERMSVTSRGTIFNKQYVGTALMGGYSLIGTISPGNIGNGFLHVRINTVQNMMVWIKVFGYSYVYGLIEGMSGGYIGGGTGGVNQGFINGSIAAQYQNGYFLEVVVSLGGAGATSNRWGSVTFLGGTDTIASVQPLEISAYSFTSTADRVY